MFKGHTLNWRSGPQPDTLFEASIRDVFRRFRKRGSGGHFAGKFAWASVGTFSLVHLAEMKSSRGFY
jgi:hypothetical protein